MSEVLSQWADSQGWVDRLGCAHAWGAYWAGTPTQSGAARNGGLVVDGVFSIDAAARLADRSIIGDNSRFPGLKLDPREGGWPTTIILGQPSQRSHLENLSLSSVAPPAGWILNGVHLTRVNTAVLRNIQVNSATGTGIYLSQCQTLMAAESLRVVGGGDGIYAEGCDGLQGMVWRVTGCSGDGIQIIGDYQGAGPWPFNGDVDLCGVIVESCGGRGIVIQDHLLPVTLHGQLRVESAIGSALVIDRAPLTMTSGRLSSADPNVVHLLNGSRLTLLGDVYLDCHTPGVGPKVLVESGSEITGPGGFYSYPGRRVEIITL